MSRFHRALVGTLVTAVTSAALVVGGAAPASAVDSNTCLSEGSTRLLTANDGEYKVWIDPYTPAGGLTEYYVCVGVGQVFRGTFTFRTPVGGVLVPTVVPDTDDQDCPRLLEVQDPVDLMTRFAETLGANPSYLCFGVADLAYRLTVELPAPIVSPNVELDIDQNTTVWDAICSSGLADCDPTRPVHINIV